MRLDDLLTKKNTERFERYVYERHGERIEVVGSDEFIAKVKDGIRYLRMLPEAFDYVLRWLHKIEEVSSGQPRVLEGTYYIPPTYSIDSPVYLALTLVHEAKHMDPFDQPGDKRWNEADAINGQIAFAYGLLGLGTLSEAETVRLNGYIDFLKGLLEDMNDPEKEPGLWYHKPVE